MSITQQDFLASSTEQGAKNLLAALLALPEEKRGWRPAETARPALDLVAECALNNGYTATMIRNRTWGAPPHDEYMAIRSKVAAESLSELQELLEANTQRVIAAIQATPDDAMDVEIDTPYGIMTIAQSIGYPYWNMSYHEGQINYIASMLD
ncbi:MAG: DinB family protein [Fibrella sp.]|nr:DinB family protein [Armatimonadota bacterium]